MGGVCGVLYFVLWGWFVLGVWFWGVCYLAVGVGLGIGVMSEELADELHKPVRKNFKKRRVFSKHVDDIWAADLVDMQYYSRTNKGYKHILMIIVQIILKRIQKTMIKIIVLTIAKIGLKHIQKLILKIMQLIIIKHMQVNSQLFMKNNGNVLMLS